LESYLLILEGESNSLILDFFRGDLSIGSVFVVPISRSIIYLENLFYDLKAIYDSLKLSVLNTEVSEFFISGAFEGEVITN